ncbi:MAG: phosphoserine phosphatase SerB [Alphaproteobacteria bacterium]|nr:phosphoserine phosphatase SerB [Alphaproteobacteria bacterium]
MRAVAAAHGAAAEIDWLCDRQAFDIAFAGEPRAVLNAARQTAQGMAADINVVSALNRRKRLLIADMDSTIITAECLDEIADMLGLKAEIAAITERAMRGEIAFEPALRERVRMLKGLRLDALEQVMRERIRLTEGARTLVLTMRHHGAHTLLVSGGFTFFTQRVAEAAGFDAQRANHLLDDGEFLTGTVAEPILGRQAKLEALQSEAARLGLKETQTLAVGDGANDLAMIERAGLGVAFHAKPVVAAAAAARIDHADLRGLLFLQGYRSDEFVV